MCFDNTYTRNQANESVKEEQAKNTETATSTSENGLWAGSLLGVPAGSVTVDELKELKKGAEKTASKLFGGDFWEDQANGHVEDILVAGNSKIQLHVLPPSSWEGVHPEMPMIVARLSEAQDQVFLLNAIEIHGSTSMEHHDESLPHTNGKAKVWVSGKAGRNAAVYVHPDFTIDGQIVPLQLDGVTPLLELINAKFGLSLEPVDPPAAVIAPTKPTKGKAVAAEA